MKSKLFILMFVCIFLVGTVSAFEFDNVKSYDPITKTATIKNAFGLGDTIAEVKLNTPLNYKVSRGYQKVAEFEVKSFGDYNNAFKELELFDKTKGMKKFLRDYDFKSLSYENIIIDDYALNCYEVWNKINKTYQEECSQVLSGSHEEQREKWTKLTPADFKKNDIVTIGIFTEVQKGDYVEWIPNLFGVRVKEWATWTEDLNTDLASYYKLDKGSGTDAIDSLGINNLTGAGALDWISSGLINNASGFYTNIANKLYTEIDGEANVTISFWLNQTNYIQSTNCNGGPCDVIMGSTSDQRLTVAINSGGFVEVSRGSGSSWGSPSYLRADTAVTEDTWTHIVITWAGANTTFYINGVINGSHVTDITTFPTMGTFALGQAFTITTTSNMYLDEVGIWNRTLSNSEINDLYNNGDGITYTDQFEELITLISPIDNYVSSTKDIQFNCSAIVSVGATIQNMTLWHNATGTLARNTTNIVSGVTNETIFDITFGEDGNYNWTCSMTDSDNDEGFAISNRTLSIDTSPPMINVISPKETINFHMVGNNLTLNWSVTDLNLQSCWFTYDDTNTTVTCDANNFSFITTNQKNLTFFANDSLGNLASNITSWDYKVLEINQTFNNQTTEGSLETFIATISLENGLSIDNINFYYNNSLSTGQSFLSGDDIILIKSDFLIPNVDTITNNTFIWEVMLSDSTHINLTSQNQTIFNLGLDNCSSFNNELLNFTVVDEEFQTNLPNTTLEIAVNVFSEDRKELIINFSNIFQNTNPVSICLNENISADIIYSLDSIIRYVGDDHANEYYNIINLLLTNDSTVQKITLFDLNLSDSTEFQLTFTGADFLPVENALINVDRQYISENIFKTVELPKTDFNGQTILHLVVNDVIYNIRIIKDGVLLGNFENLVAFCDDITIGDCNIELNAFDSVENIFNYDEDLGIIFQDAPKFNSTTNRVSFNFVTSDGSAKTVTLEVSRNDIFGNRSICNSSLTSSGGTLFCDVDPNIEDSDLRIQILTNDILILTGNVELDTTNYGDAGYLIMFLMAMSFALLFSGSKTGVLLSIGLTFAGSIGLGLRSGNLIGVGASGLWLLVIIFIGIYKLNSERQT